MGRSWLRYAQARGTNYPPRLSSKLHWTYLLSPPRVIQECSSALLLAQFSRPQGGWWGGLFWTQPRLPGRHVENRASFHMGFLRSKSCSQPLFVPGCRGAGRFSAGWLVYHNEALPLDMCYRRI